MKNTELINNIKNLICKKGLLYHPDFSKAFTIKSDASDPRYWRNINARGQSY